VRGFLSRAWDHLSEGDKQAVEPNSDVIKAEAVSGLRAALLEGAGVPDAVRQCYYRHPIFAATLFTQAVRQWFGLGCDVRDITQFISRTSREGVSPYGSLPRREAEALVRAALGEVALLEDVDPKVFNYPEIGIAVLGQLFSEWRPGSRDVEALFERAASVSAEACAISPQLVPAEANWFAERMHYSPFAFSVTGGAEYREG
jgi:hypothetical protein